MKNDEVEKQVEEVLQCYCRPCAIEPCSHTIHCPALHRPAVLALLERREQKRHAEIQKILLHVCQKAGATYLSILREASGFIGSLEKACELIDQALQRREDGYAADEMLWRTLFWFNHARYTPFVHTPYGDDGEMQCCGIDFKRMSAAEIGKVLSDRAIESGAVEQPDLERREQEHAAEVKETRTATLRAAAEIPHVWAVSKSCTGHSTDPCCHVWLGEVIERKILALIQPPEPPELGPCGRHGKKFQPLNQRMWDLIRHQRMELHEAELITDEEYARLAEDHPAVARLEDYDKLRATTAQREQEIMRWKKAIEGLTPSGSEFVDDPEACAAYIRNRWTSSHKRLVATTKALHARDEGVRKLVGAAMRVHIDYQIEARNVNREYVANLEAALAPYLPPAVPEPKG